MWGLVQRLGLRGRGRLGMRSVGFSSPVGFGVGIGIFGLQSLLLRGSFGWGSGSGRAPNGVGCTLGFGFGSGSNELASRGVGLGGWVRDLELGNRDWAMFRFDVNSVQARLVFHEA